MDNTRKYKKHRKAPRYVITKNHFIYATLFFSFGSSTITGFSSLKKEGTILQVLIVEVVCILPLYFLMTLIGHYSQSSCVAVGWMQPIMAGYSFVVIVNSFLGVLFDFLAIRDIGIYLVYTLTTGGKAFLDCNLYSTIESYCIDFITSIEDLKEQSKKQGYPLNTSNLVTYMFYRSALVGAYKGTSDTSLAYLQVTTKMLQVILNFVLPFFLFFLAQIRFSKGFKVFKPLSLIFMCEVVIVISMLFTIPGGYEELKMYYNKMKDKWRYFNYEIWFWTLGRQIKNFSPLGVHHISLAALLDPKADTEVAALEAWFVHVIVGFLNSTLYHAVKGVLHRSIVERTQEVKNKSLEYLIVYFPAAADFIAVGDIIILIGFYGFLFTAWCFKNSITIQMIFNCITDIFPFTVQYKKYIETTFLLVIAVISYFVFTTEYKDEDISWLDRGQSIPVLVCLVLFSTFTLWFYGVTNLCDDVHFKVGNPPSVFWKIFLWPMPLIFLMMLAINSSSYSDRFSESVGNQDISYFIVIVIQFLYALPFVIAGIYEIIIYIVKKKLLWLVRPQERWGDPDPEERIARRKYPPRFETKFRRRFDYCKHRCLRYNKVLHAIDEKEYDTRAALLNLPQELIEEKKYLYSIMKKMKD